MGPPSLPHAPLPHAPLPHAPLPPDLDEQSVFRTLFAAYPDALVVADARGAIVLANPAAAGLLGYTVAELVGLNVDVLVPDAIRPRHAAYRDAYAHHPRPRPMGTGMELVAKRRDGSEVMVEISLNPPCKATACRWSWRRFAVSVPTRA